MLAIKPIITEFTPEEAQAFLQFQQKRNRRGDTKNAALFSLIYKGETKDLDLKLYGKPEKNNFYGLCNRLQESLIDFIALKSFSNETSEEMDILKLLLAARILFEQKQHKVAFKTIEKAKQKAEALDIFSILTEIYHTQIQYAHLNPKLNLEQLKAECQKNLQHFQQEQQLNMVYATINGELKSEGYKKINEVIEDAFSEFTIKIDSALSYKAFYQILQIIASVAKIDRDYHANLSYIMHLHELIEAKQEPYSKHLFYYIQITYLMAFVYFRNKQFDKTSKLLEQMESAMRMNQSKYHKRFFTKYISLKALHLNYRGDFEKAIAFMEAHQENSLEIKLSLIMSYFQQNQFKQAYQVFKSLRHSDQWYEKKMGWVWVLKKNIIEILLLIELDKLDLVLIRLRSFRRKYTQILKEHDEIRVITFMKLVALYYEDPDNVTTEAFKERVENSFDWIGKEREDIFVMSFYAWLKSKMEQTPLYETTLDLVSQ